MATYNWSYRPGVTNKYGITIPTTDDDVRPDGVCYVALYGNDVRGNGSRMYPYKTITRAVLLGNVKIVLGSGTYRESASIVPTSITTLIGDGDVILEASYWNLFINNVASQGVYAYNLKVTGDGYSSFFNGAFSFGLRDVFFDGCAMTMPGAYVGDGDVINCTFYNIFNKVKLGLTERTWNGCTFVNCNDVDLQSDNRIKIQSHIFYNCNISGATLIYRILRYSLFYKCNFKFDGSAGGGLLYPSVPAGYSYFSDIETLRAYFTANFGGNSLNGCKIGDPKFNNESIGDFSLKFDSDAKNLSYFGTFVGANSIGYSIKASYTEADGDFDFASIVNLVVANDSIILSDSSLDGSIETKVKTNLIGRELAKAPIFGFNADRNGQYIDSIADLAVVANTTADGLTTETPYLVEIASITYDGAVYQPGEKFTSKSVTTFTSDGGGVCREILEAPQRHTILARFSNGGAYKEVGDPLSIGFWYYVNGTISYNGNDYSNTVFKAIDTSSFTGTGEVREAMTDQVYQHYEPGIKFMSNNVGDVRTGEIIRGNGDPDYERGAGKEFPINSRFIQLKYIIRVNNLKP